MLHKCFACINMGVSVFAQLCVCLCVCVYAWCATVKICLPACRSHWACEHLKSSSLYCLHWIPIRTHQNLKVCGAEPDTRDAALSLDRRSLRSHWQGLTFQPLDCLDFCLHCCRAGVIRQWKSIFFMFSNKPRSAGSPFWWMPCWYFFFFCVCVALIIKID